MEIKNINEFKKIINDKGSGFAIAIWGVEKQKIKNCINMLYELVQVMPELNIIKLEGNTINYDEVVNACESLPVLSNKKVVHIKNPYFIKKTEKNAADTEGASLDNSDKTNSISSTSSKDNLVDYLSNYVNNIPSDTIVVLSSDEEVGTGSKVINRIKANGYIMEFKQLKGADLNNYVKERFSEYGKKINTTEIMYFISIMLNNFEMMDKEIEKLCAYAINEDTITKKHIDEITHKGIENNVFKMIDSISIRNADSAIAILDALLFQKEEPLKILSMIIRQYRILYLLYIMNQQKKSIEEIKVGLKSKKINLMDFMINNYMKQIGKYDANSLKKALELCFEADTSIKNSRLPTEMIMEMLILKLCG